MQPTDHDNVLRPVFCEAHALFIEYGVDDNRQTRAELI